MKAKFEYGKVYEVAPTMGMDAERGEIEIEGIIRYDHLPEESHYDVWLTGDAEFDWLLMIEPWYLFSYIEREKGECIYLPEFALEEIIDKADKDKEKWRNNRLIGVAR